MRHTLIAAVAVMGLAFSGPLQAAEDGRKAWTIAGSGTNTLLTQVLVKAFREKHPGVNISVLSPMGSSGAFRAVHKEKISLGLITRPPRGIEQTWGLKVLPYARTVIAFGAHPDVPDDGLSTVDVRDIYSGKRKKWSNGAAIVVIAREEGDSSAEVLMKAVADFKDILESVWRSGIWRVEYRDDDCNAAIERLKGSVGWTDLGSIRAGNRRVKPLKFNGAAPTAENLASGKYPLYKELSFLHRGPLPAQLLEFVNFVKSDEGKELIRKYDYIPLP